jgi:hypothetical protein
MPTLSFLIISGFVLYYVVRLPDDVLRYIWFLNFTHERKACGLFIEGYFKRKDAKRIPVISLIVVYFDVRAEELKIASSGSSPPLAIVLHPVGRDAERSELKRAFCSSLSEL